MPAFVDSHCHLDFPVFAPQRAAELQACAEQGVVACVVPGVSRATWPRLHALLRQHSADCANPANPAAPQLFAAYGLHPAFQHQHEDIDKLADCLQHHAAVAVGEFGLDYYLSDTDRAEQQHYFHAQLDIARQLHLPVILHVRKAHDDVLKQLRRQRLPRAGVIHAYSGSAQQAQQYIDLGFKLGFGGAVTYPRARKLQQHARDLPLDTLLLETDAPDMRPSFLKPEQTHSPRYLPTIAQHIANLRDIPLQNLAQASCRNADSLFKLGLGTG